MIRSLVVAFACAAATAEAVRNNASVKPNFLLLFPDQWRYDWDGLTQRLEGPDVPIQMPTMRSLAQRGVRFTQAYVPAPLCAPSRSCLASGREYDASGVPSNFVDFPRNLTSIYGVLQGAGYHTILVGKDDLTKSSRLGYKTRYPHCPFCRDGDGLYRQAEMGFSDGLRTAGKHAIFDTVDPWERYGFYLNNNSLGSATTVWDAQKICFNSTVQGRGPCVDDSLTGKFYPDNFTTMNAIKLLARRPLEKPFFMQVNFLGPHPPHAVTAAMHTSVCERVWPRAVDGAADEDVSCSCNGPVVAGGFSKCHYAAELEHLDGMFQEILNEVDRQGELERTVVMVSSDHGHMLGDHGQINKRKPWQGSVSVPLIVVGATHAGPKILAGHEVHRPVATLDLGGTVLDFAGVEPDSGMTTVSLRPLLTGEDRHSYRPFVSSGLLDWRLVVKQLDGISYKYICCHGKCPGAPSTAPPVSQTGWTEMLINVDEDPFDMHDLSQDLPDITDSMRALLPVDGYCRARQQSLRH